MKHCNVLVVSVSLPADIVQRLDREAAAQQRNRSNFVAVALADYLARHRHGRSDARTVTARRVSA
ncbi:MAG: ribbon-helix-helix domain-containing protein [Steroidobacteraceae bacterium]